MNKQINKIFIKSAQAYIVLALSRQRQEDCKNHFFQLISGRAFWAAARVVSKAGWWCGLGESQRHGQGSAGAWLAQVRPRGQLQPADTYHFPRVRSVNRKRLGKSLGSHCEVKGLYLTYWAESESGLLPHGLPGHDRLPECPRAVFSHRKCAATDSLAGHVG